MAVDTREIEVRIRDEIDGEIGEICVIHLGRGQSLFDILAAKRPFVSWFNVRSVYLHASPALNLNPRGSTVTQSRFRVDTWGENLFTTNNPRHRLTLTLDPVGEGGSGAAGAGRCLPRVARPPRGA